MPSYRRRVRIDHDSPEPRYLQVADYIRTRILSGSYAPNTLVPSLERIRQETGLSTMTIRKGIRILASEGFVRIIPGKGTFVTPSERWPG